MIGQMLGHYRIEAKLGEGGMGVVYRARDTRLNRFAAIKVLPAERIADPERKRRFAQEAKAASALNHPNIVHIYGIDTEGTVDFIAMEYVEGRTLDQVIGRLGLNITDALQYAIQIADGLAAAHSADIVHRDIKPSNIMVTEKGLIKILDFGLAKLVEQDHTDPEAATETIAQRTEEGTVLGTAAYMSPEQAEGKKMDARSDIFSFGSLLYEMVTGQRAFRGDSRMAILAAILNSEPALLREATPKAVPPELQTLISRCLRKDPQRRIQHLDDLKLTLEEIKQEQISQSRVRPRRGWPAAAATLVLLAAGLFAWWASRQPERTEPLQAVPLNTQPGVQRYPSFSPDGNHVVFTWTGPKQDNTDLYVQQIGAGAPLRLTLDPRTDYNPVWSPDGRSIAFLRLQTDGVSELRLIPPLGGQDRKLAEIRIREVFVIAPYLTWCPDSTCLVVTDSSGSGKPLALFVVSVESGEKRQLTYPQSPVAGDAHPAVSPDGKWLVFRRYASGIFSGELHLLPLKNGVVSAGEPVRLTPATLDAGYPAWVPGSKELVFSARGSMWRMAAVPGVNPERLPFIGEDGIMAAVSRPLNGQQLRLAYARNFDDLNIWRIEVPVPGTKPSAGPVVSIFSTRREGMPNLSPDARRVAFFSDRTGVGGIWVSDLDGSNAVQIAAMHAPATGYPHWSPDGTMIAFHSNAGGQADVYIVPAGGGKPRNLTSNPARDSFPSFSRDAKWIYFTSNRLGEDRIFKMPASGGEAVPVSDRIGYMPAESPDRAWIYYVETVFTPGGLWRMPVTGGIHTKIADGVLLGNFVVLDKGIYYIDRPSGEAGIYWIDRPGETRLQYFEFATGSTTTVVSNLGSVDTPLTASADGRLLMYSRIDASIDDIMLVDNFR